MLLDVQTHAPFPILPVLAASTHALTDFRKPPRLLAASYAVPALALSHADPALTTVAFATASVFHFRTDVGGARNSLAMHAVWVLLLATLGCELAFDCFSLFYLLVHVPRHVAVEMRTNERIGWLALTAFVLWGLAASGDEALVSQHFLLTDPMQTVVVGHAIASEIATENENQTK